MARKGKIVEPKKINNNANSYQPVTNYGDNNKENTMDDRFDDVLKVNRNNTSSDIYKKYEMLKKQSEETETEKTSDDTTNINYGNCASFYSVLKPKSEREKTVVEDKQEEIIEEEIDDTEIDSKDHEVMFDLFNLNIKDSDTENLYQEKKLVNNNYKKVISDDNKIETVKAQDEPNYSFQKTNEEVNYQDTFKDLRKNKQPYSNKGKFDRTYDNNSPVSTVDLKNKLYASGYKIRTYQKLDSENYYSLKFYLSNKLNRDCSFITSILMIIIVGIMWLAFDSYVKLPVMTYVGLMLGFLLLPIIGIIKYHISPKARKSTNFSFKLAILNAIMAYLLGIVVCLLVSFFAVGADISDISTLVCPLFYPMFVMLVLPIYVIVYQLLYVTKMYYIE